MWVTILYNVLFNRLNSRTIHYRSEVTSPNPVIQNYILDCIVLFKTIYVFSVDEQSVAVS